MATPRAPHEHGRIRRPSPLSECGSAVTLTKKAWVSTRTLILALPKPQLLFGQGIEKESVGDVVFSLEKARHAPRLGLLHRRQPRHWLLVARNHDLLARFGAGDQVGQLRFRLANGNGGHCKSLRIMVLSYERSM